MARFPKPMTSPPTEGKSLAPHDLALAPHDLGSLISAQSGLREAVVDFAQEHAEITSQALYVRALEEQLLRLFEQGLLNGTVHTCVGQELVGPVLMSALRESDYVVSNHRGHGHYYARTHDARGLLGELMGKTCGVTGGIGGSQHLVAPNYLSNGVQGGMTPVAAGLAHAARLRGDKGVVVAFLGDGTLGEGLIYESLNICALRQLPILFVVENNQYAQSTSVVESFAGDARRRFEGFGVHFDRQTIWQPQGLLDGAQAAVGRARGGVPQCLMVDCYRLNAHSKGDDNRSADEVLAYRQMDPLTILLESGDESSTRAYRAAQRSVKALSLELQGKSPLVSLPRRQTFSGSAHFIPIEGDASERIGTLINRALVHALETDPRVCLLGEDICDRTVNSATDYGGAFKITRGLSTRFPQRVLNFPISEAAQVGFGTGLALAGQRPIVELMFGDFLTLAFDQLYQHAAKFRAMYNQKVSVPLVIRTPMGGKRGYGPTHSQSIEKFFIGIPGLRVVALNSVIPPADLYRAIMCEEDPVLVIENKLLYTYAMQTKRDSGYSVMQTDEPFPTAWLSMDGLTPDVTVICYGEMLETAEQAALRAFEEDEIITDILVPSSLSPVPVAGFLPSIRQSGRLVILEEGPNVAAFGSEVVARVLEEGLHIKVLRRLGNNGVIPCSVPAELEQLPNPASAYQIIVDAAGCEP